MADDPREAGKPRTAGPTRVYEREEMAVLWDATKCIHVATCIQVLPEVFDPQRRPWIDIHAADAQAIARAVRLCPTGALKMQARGDFPLEEPDEPTSNRAGRSGPLFVRGRVRLTDSDGNASEETRVALCRCGASANKPYCDNSHRLVRKQRPVPEEES